jgi:L-fuculose-phosphate aldolase
MIDRNHADLRQGIVDTCLEMNRNGLNQGTSGNLSHRIPGGMLITPTSLPYERMQPKDVVAMDFAANYEGNHRPSSEWRFHRDILRARDDVTTSAVRPMPALAHRRYRITPSKRSKAGMPACSVTMA